jgi:hypothetical protein
MDISIQRQFFVFQIVTLCPVVCATSTSAWQARSDVSAQVADALIAL